MGVFDFLKKKKPEDEFLDLGGPGVGGPGGGFGPAGGFGAGGMAGMPPGVVVGGMPRMGGIPMQGPGFDMGPSMMPQMSPPTPMGAGQDQVENLRRSIESLNYKMDALKSLLENVGARLQNMETALKSAPQERGEGWGAF